MLKNGYKWCQVDHTLVVKHLIIIIIKHKKGNVTTLFVYITDILVTGDDQYKINNLKGFLSKEFKKKDLGLLKYFLGIGDSYCIIS